MKPWRDMTAEEREEAIRHIEGMVAAHPGWGALKSLMEDRIEKLRDRLAGVNLSLLVKDEAVREKAYLDQGEMFHLRTFLRKPLEEIDKMRHRAAEAAAQAEPERSQEERYV